MKPPEKYESGLVNNGEGGERESSSVPSSYGSQRGDRPRVMEGVNPQVFPLSTTTIDGNSSRWQPSRHSSYGALPEISSSSLDHSVTQKLMAIGHCECSLVSGEHFCQASTGRNGKPSSEVPKLWYGRTFQMVHERGYKVGPS